MPHSVPPDHPPHSLLGRAEPVLRRALPALYVVAAAIGTLVCGVAQQCNNFRIFRAAHANLLAGADLYALHPGQHLDLFKYSPTFALLFAPFTVGPFPLALFGWNVLNALLLYWAVRRLLPGPRGTLALALLWLGFVTTMDGTQSNGLVAALIVLAFLAVEQGKGGRAAWLVALGALVKIFPVAALAFAWLRPRPWRPLAAFAGAMGVLVALPLLVVTPAELAAQYRSWWTIEGVDALDRGHSVMRLLHEWGGYDGPNWPVQLAGAVALMLPLLSARVRRDAARRRLMLASLLLYVVLFNHKAEQPTWIIALAGVAIWCVSAPRARRGTIRRLPLAGATLLATVPMMVAGLMPHWGARQPLLPMLLVTGCCALVWGSVQAELLASPLAVARRRFPRRAPAVAHAQPQTAHGAAARTAYAGAVNETGGLGAGDEAA